MTHTPGPWTVEHNVLTRIVAPANVRRETVVATIAQRNNEDEVDANAAFIVQAWNSHDALLAAVHQALWNCAIDNHAGSDDFDCQACNQYRAAIAQATEGRNA